jgi:hypothetical protein
MVATQTGNKEIKAPEINPKNIPKVIMAASL